MWLHRMRIGHRNRVEGIHGIDVDGNVMWTVVVDIKSSPTCPVSVVSM